MTRRDVTGDVGLERRLRAEAPGVGAYDADAAASVMARVGRSEPGACGVYPARPGARVGVLVAVVAVGLSVWLVIGLGGGGMRGDAGTELAGAGTPPAARIGDSTLTRVSAVGDGAPGERALVDEGRRVLDDARRLRDALATRLASLERASAGLPRGG